MRQDARRSAAMRVAAAAAGCAMVVTGAIGAAAGSAGTWGKAIEVPGTAALDQGRTAGLFSVSCASAGNCAAGGFYADSPDSSQAFVAGEVKGTWQKAIEVPGTAALNQGGAPRPCRCRAPRRATAPPAGSTPTAPATTRRSSPAR